MNTPDRHTTDRHTTDRHTPLDDDREDASLAPIDFVLGQGADAARNRMASAASSDPVTMLAVAETVTLVEQFRQLQVAPATSYGIKLATAVAQAERAQRLRLPVARRTGPLLAAAAAAVTFWVLFATDPLRWARPSRPLAALGDTQAGAVGSGDPGLGKLAEGSDLLPIRDADEVAWESAVEQMRNRLRLEPSPHLASALEAGLRPTADRLSPWLDSRNTLMLMRLDHELRASAELRREALRRQGGLPAADARIQQLATALAEDLPTAIEQVDNGACDLPTIALVVRALLAAGPDGSSRERAVGEAGAWLATRLPDCHGAGLVAALSALAEVAAVTGEHLTAVAEHGQRLVDSVLQPGGRVWQRGLPDLLGRSVAAADVGDAGRLLRRLPGLGVAPDRCALLRQLLFAQLEARLANGWSGPELATALWFGFDDLLTDSARDELDRQLRRWQPVRLAPDYRTVQQLAWAIEPGTRGFTRWQGELRQLTVQPTPGDLGNRAAFCLCLAAGFAASGSDGRSRLAGS